MLSVDIVLGLALLVHYHQWQMIGRCRSRMFGVETGSLEFALQQQGGASPQHSFIFQLMMGMVIFVKADADGQCALLDADIMLLLLLLGIMAH